MTIVEGKEPFPWLLIPAEEKDTAVLFIFLIGIEFLVVVFPFHVYFFVLIYFFVDIFPPPSPATNMEAAASQKKSSPYPLYHHQRVVV